MTYVTAPSLWYRLIGNRNFLLSIQYRTEEGYQQEGARDGSKETIKVSPLHSLSPLWNRTAPPVLVFPGVGRVR